MSYYRIEGEIMEYYETYVKAKNVYDAIKKVEKVDWLNLDEAEAFKISKKEYDKNKFEE